MPLACATALPTTAEHEALEDIEQVYCATLVWANHSWGALKAENHRRDLVIAEPRCGLSPSEWWKFPGSQPLMADKIRQWVEVL